MRHSDLRTTQAAKEFQQAYRSNALHNALRQRTIERVIALLRSAEVEPILVKGRAAAELYPEPGLRLYGDVDLCVRPEQFTAAEEALKNLGAERYEVDLHCGFAKFGGSDVDEIYARTRLIKIGETDVRVPCEEDHLRVLCIHLLREGAWRALWLCDVAAAVESRGANFDWDRCLTNSRRRAECVRYAVGLAQALLGADASGTPTAQRKGPLPRWLIPAVLKEWESTRPSSMAQRHRAPMASFIRHPAGVFRGLRYRWPNPIEATVITRAPFNEWPRLPFQFGSCLAQAVKFAGRLPKLRRENSPLTHPNKLP